MMDKLEDLVGQWRREAAEQKVKALAEDSASTLCSRYWGDHYALLRCARQLEASAPQDDRDQRIAKLESHLAECRHAKEEHIRNGVAYSDKLRAERDELRDQVERLRAEAGKERFTEEEFVRAFTTGADWIRHNATNWTSPYYAEVLAKATSRASENFREIMAAKQPARVGLDREGVEAIARIAYRTPPEQAGVNAALAEAERRWGPLVQEVPPGGWSGIGVGSDGGSFPPQQQPSGISGEFVDGIAEAVMAAFTQVRAPGRGLVQADFPLAVDLAKAAARAYAAEHGLLPKPSPPTCGCGACVRQEHSGTWLWFDDDNEEHDFEFGDGQYCPDCGEELVAP